MIKKCVGYISHCCLIYFIDYIVSTLFTEKASTLLITCIFLNILLIRIQGFPGGKIKKMSWDFHENCHGKPGNVMFFFQKYWAHWVIKIAPWLSSCFALPVATLRSLVSKWNSQYTDENFFRMFYLKRCLILTNQQHVSIAFLFYHVSETQI